MRYEQDVRAKEKSIRDMFSRIARRYDLTNWVMSGGQDRRWRRVAVKLARPCGGRVLDVATGTGEMALELAENTDSVVGLDFCPEMLGEGRVKVSKRRLGKRIDFILGNALELPFIDNSFDCALNGFALRNMASINSFLSELYRVVKPGGRVVCLEFVKPSAGIWGALYRFYLFKVIPITGHLLTGDIRAYQYLPDSVDSFMSRSELQRIMEGVGFRQVSSYSLNLGTVAIHVGVK